jgi:hypothetical protein
MGDVARPLPAHRTAQTQNKCTQTSMPEVGFEPTVPVFEWVKTFHALEHVAIVISTDHCLVVAKVRERTTIRKRETQQFHMERFNLKRLNEIGGKEL